MSDPAASVDPDASIPSSDEDADVRFALLEMGPTTEPAWLVDAREAIQAAGDRSALNATVGRLQSQRLSEAQRVQIRPILAAQWQLVEAAEAERKAASSRKVTPAHGVAVVAAAAATVAGAAQDAEDVAAYAAAVAQTNGLPAQLVASGSGGVMHTVEAQVGPGPAFEAKPMVARWREIKVAGPYQGQWGAAVEHVRDGVPIQPPAVGDVVIVYRAHGGGAQPKRVAAIVRADAERGYSLCAVSDPPPGARATMTRPRAAQPSTAGMPPGAVPLVAPSAPRPLPFTAAAATRLAWIRGQLGEHAPRLDALIASMPEAELRPWSERLASMGRDDALALTRIRLGPSGAANAAALSGGLLDLDEPNGTLESDLTAIGAEGASNAAVADLGAQSQSNATSTTIQRRGVGFSSWEGYREALRRGGLQSHTREEYIAHVRSHVTAEEVASYPTANVNALPVGAGIVHTPTGPDVFSMTAAQRKEHLRVGKSDAKLTGAALMRRSDVIAGALDAGAGGEFAWEGLGTLKRGKLVEALTALDRADIAPAAKDAAVQLSRAVRSLPSSRYDAHAVESDERPDNVTARHVVIDRDSLPNGSQAIAAGGRAAATVEIALTVDMLDDGTIAYHGDAQLAAKVRADYDLRTAEATLNSADMTAWLQGILITRHGATRYGSHWYVPGAQREAVIALTRAVRGTGWGRRGRWIHGTPITTGEALIEGIADGFLDEIEAVERKWTQDRADARAAYNTFDGKGKRMRQTEDLTARGAAGHLKELTRIKERINGYAVLLGDEAIKEHRARVAKMDAEIRLLCDDTTIRGAMLEFS